MALTPKHPTITPSRTRNHRSTGALALAASFVLCGAFAAAACGGNSNAGSTPGGHAASANGGEGDGAGSSSGGSSASSSTGGSSGSSHTGGSSSTSGGTSSASGGSDAAGGDATGDTGGTTSGGTSSGGSSASGATGGTTTTGTTACDNGIDDDGDGLTDGFDPECTGPWDNDEGSFATGIPGDNKDPKWQDCFFDGNSGGGDDGCRYPTGCLTGDVAADDKSCSLAQNCIDYCARLTPNGCDCFGCCTVQGADGTSVDIFTTSSCSIDKIGDEAACPRCQKSLDCQNTCGECELCPGKTEADLPESCTPPPTTGTGGSSGTGGSGGTGSGGTDSGTGGTGTGGTDSGTGGTGGTGGTDTPPPPTHTCEGGLTVCGPGLPACEGGMYCQQGCCMFVVR